VLDGGRKNLFRVLNFFELNSYNRHLIKVFEFESQVLVGERAKPMMSKMRVYNLKVSFSEEVRHSSERCRKKNKRNEDGVSSETKSCVENAWRAISAFNARMFLII
jgi:hypothetical protein